MRDWGITNYDLRMTIKLKHAVYRTITQINHSIFIQQHYYERQGSQNPEGNAAEYSTHLYTMYPQLKKGCGTTSPPEILFAN